MPTLTEVAKWVQDNADAERAHGQAHDAAGDRQGAVYHYAQHLLLLRLLKYILGN